MMCLSGNADAENRCAVLIYAASVTRTCIRRWLVGERELIFSAGLGAGTNYGVPS